MDITAINRGEVGVHAPAPVAPVDNTAEHRQIVQAVKAVNGTEMFGVASAGEFYAMSPASSVANVVP